MATSMNFPSPVNRLVVQGPFHSNEGRATDASGLYPGLLVKKGSTDDDVAIAGAGDAVIGFAGYDDASAGYKPASLGTAYNQYDRVPVVSCVGSVIRACLATGQTITRGAALIAATGGMVAAVGTSTARIVGYAEQSVTTTSGTAAILIRSMI